MKEHKRALTCGNAAQSAVAEHAMDVIHVINWEEAQIVVSHPHYTLPAVHTAGGVAYQVRENQLKQRRKSTVIYL